MALALVATCVGVPRQHPFIAVAVVVAAFVAWVFMSESKSVEFPANLQRVREKAGSRRFRWRTRKAYYLDCAELFKEAHDTVGTWNVLGVAKS
jgi:hypothetical protein